MITTRYLLDFGPTLDKGIVANYPPSLAGRTAYPIFVSKVDQDGNEVAGIRLPPVEAPIATTTGWALRRDGFGENDGCEANGQHIAFEDRGGTHGGRRSARCHSRSATRLMMATSPLFARPPRSCGASGSCFPRTSNATSSRPARATCCASVAQSAGSSLRSTPGAQAAQSLEPRAEDPAGPETKDQRPKT